MGELQSGYETQFVVIRQFNCSFGQTVHWSLSESALCCLPSCFEQFGLLETESQSRCNHSAELDCSIAGETQFQVS